MSNYQKILHMTPNNKPNSNIVYAILYTIMLITFISASIVAYEKGRDLLTILFGLISVYTFATAFDRILLGFYEIRNHFWRKR